MSEELGLTIKLFTILCFGFMLWKFGVNRGEYCYVIKFTDSSKHYRDYHILIHRLTYLYEDVKSINEELEDLKQVFKTRTFYHRKTEKEEKFLEYNMSLKSLTDNLNPKMSFTPLLNRTSDINEHYLYNIFHKKCDIILTSQTWRSRKSNESSYMTDWF